MRNRHSLAILVLLMLPAGLDAQRPRLGIGGGTRPAPLPPTAPAIAREMSYTYRRLAFSVESYPMISVVSAAGFLAEGSTSHWTSYGVGNRISHRIRPWLFGTLDLTTAPYGGLTTTSTVELGARLLPDVWDHRLHPYVDARYGYMFAYEGYSTSTDNAISPSVQGVRGARYSEGFGGIIGGGLRFSLTRTLMASIGTSMMQNRMSNHRITVATTGTGPDEYRITSWRHSIGLRWNPVRSIVSDPTDGRR